MSETSTVVDDDSRLERYRERAEELRARIAAGTLRVLKGSHDVATGEGCAMNLVAWAWSGDITDSPECVHPIISRHVQIQQDAEGRTEAAAATGRYGHAAALGITGRAKAGEDGSVIVGWWDSAAKRPRVTVGYTGENGIERDVWYGTDETGALVALVDEEVAS